MPAMFGSVLHDVIPRNHPTVASPVSRQLWFTSTRQENMETSAGIRHGSQFYVNSVITEWLSLVRNLNLWIYSILQSHNCLPNFTKIYTDTSSLWDTHFGTPVSRVTRVKKLCSSDMSRMPLPRVNVRYIFGKQSRCNYVGFKSNKSYHVITPRQDCTSVIHNLLRQSHANSYVSQQNTDIAACWLLHVNAVHTRQLLWRTCFPGVWLPTHVWIPKVRRTLKQF
jgi:hypothetical protein